MKERTVEVYCSTQAVDVHIAKTRLESEGITCFVTGEALNQVFGGVQGISQGVSLLVRSEEAERALDILRQEGYIPEEDDAQDGISADKRRTELNKKLWTLIALILLVLLMLAVYTHYVA